MSSGRTITVRAVPAATLTLDYRDEVLIVADIIGDPVRNLLYVATGQYALNDANSVLAFDPLTRTVTKRLVVGEAPSEFAVSDDGQFLYVGLNGESAVRQVGLASFTLGLKWSLPATHVVGDMVVMPGSPRTVAIAPRNAHPVDTRFVIYQDGVPLPQSAPTLLGADYLVTLGAPDTLYGHSFDFATFAVDQSGIRRLKQTAPLMNADRYLAGVDGRIYGTAGSVVDAARHKQVGSFAATWGEAIYVDPKLGRIFVLDRVVGIEVYDMNTFQLLGVVPARDPWGALHYNHRLIRWSADGLAFIQSGWLKLCAVPFRSVIRRASEFAALPFADPWHLRLPAAPPRVGSRPRQCGARRPSAS